MQLIPRPKLLGDFPEHFVYQYVHWLDLDTRELEFRPAGSSWIPGPSNWRLYIHEPGIYPRAKFQKPSQDGSKIQSELIDIRSKTFSMVSNMLSPLESKKHIIATLTSQSLEVSLPRLHLLFFVNSNRELECRSIPGYIVAKTQSCGTMFGLINKLILCPRPNGSEESPLPRRVIIPQGKVSFCTRENFASVHINTNAEQHVRWHEYAIDTNLGCLTSNTDLMRKLYQCYLHALTSHCLPDPLLGHTGTEEALYMLRSSALRSFQRLSSSEAKLLKLISDLTPDRVYYPPHLQSMVNVKWNDLPALSQHHDFYQAVSSILDHASTLEAFYGQRTAFKTPKRDQLLLNRVAFRNKSYYPSDLQVSEQLSPPGDIKYRSRDVSDRESVKRAAYSTSWTIWNANPSLDDGLPDLWDLMTSWVSLGPASSEVSLLYSQYWLEFDATKDWFVIYDLCRQAVNGGLLSMKIKLSFCLSAAAYSNSNYSNIIPLFIAFALDERCRNHSPPPDLSYTLSDGIVADLARLEGMVSRSALPIDSTPAQSMFEENNTMDFRTLRSRRRAEYDMAIRRGSSQVAESILRQWRQWRQQPNYTWNLRSVNFREQWFNKSECHRCIDEYFQSISRNIRLKDHVLHLQSILQDYENVPPVPITPPYVFSPQYITGNSNAPSYSIFDVLVSRTNVPTLSVEEPSLQPSGLKSLIEEPSLQQSGLTALIEEFRHSQQPLLSLYGDELNKSHCQLVGHNASQRHYRDACSRRKDEAFSEILETLKPSENVEQINGIAGLWPRITPRSLLRQLAQNRVGTLPDQWKDVIKRYAVCLLKYQQSQRLLGLSLGQKHDELLREINAMRSDSVILAESTPDWLLVQVRPLRCMRSNQSRLT